MKEIKAMIQPHMLQKVVDALHDLPNLPGLTISDVRGFGRTGGQNGEQGGRDVRYIRKAKLEIVVDDTDVETVIAKIVEHARTGNVGDGKIFVSAVDDVVRIRTGERGTSAL